MPTLAPNAPMPGMRAPKSVIGGPQGPGGSPMVSPGTGEGMKARALDRIKKLMEGLLAESRAFEAGSGELKTILRAASDLNALFNTKKQEPARPSPPPVPATPPGAGLGGLPPQAASAALSAADQAGAGGGMGTEL